MSDKIKRYLDHDLYSVEDVNGEKQIHFYGYLYDNGDGIKNVIFHGVYLAPFKDVQDFQERFKDDEWSQSTIDCTEHTAEVILNGVQELSMLEVDQNTPVGFYVSVNRKPMSVFIGEVSIVCEGEYNVYARPFSTLEKAMEYGKGEMENFKKKYGIDDKSEKVESEITDCTIDVHDNVSFCNFFYDVAERLIDMP